ncbi:glycosyltransferase [Ancylobacter sp. FA202]|uniref:glycosyltransferase n=1 Tax=Ancylobacter sp. FA202 TaxID=1111106 RepID=UPI0003A51D2F|nr:glycosyltransferase family 4 protein [Ancylobacter sp. FA202]
MNILIATNHLALYGGSEIVCLEMAEYFKSRGHRLTVFASVAAAPMADIFGSRLGVKIVTDPREIAPFRYDLAYIQHQVAGLFDYRRDAHSLEKTAFVFGKLGRRSFMESGGWRHDRVLADAYFANSEETANSLRGAGVQAPITVFHNAAPAAFFRPSSATQGTLRTITLISNHNDPELMGAIDRLALDHKVQRIGLRQGRQAMVTPVVIHASDLIVSIGKSAPYALAGGVPVFVYDHFGGPGYLTHDNFDRAARFNFSGRCCERRLDAAALAKEIVDGYARGRAFIGELGAKGLARYRLEPYLDAMLATVPSDNAARAAHLAADPMIAQERLLATYVQSQSMEAHDSRNRPERRLGRTIKYTLIAARRQGALIARKGLRLFSGLAQSFSA